jgi:hypothetical protein
MPVTPRSRQIQDFNVDELAKTSALDELAGRVDKVETKINSADKLGEHFADAFEHSSLLRDAVSKAVLATLDNVDNRDKLKVIVKKVNHDDVMTFVNKIGFGAWTLLIALISGSVVAIVLTAVHK